MSPSTSRGCDRGTSMPPSSPERALAQYASSLADAIDGAIAPWVVRSVNDVMSKQGRSLAGWVLEEARAAGDEARATIAPSVRLLLEADVDAQRSNPLALLRQGVRYPTSVLARAGAAPVERDEQSRQMFPDDVYDLTPANFGDFGAEVAEAGIAWGAAKAFVHKQRHAAPGAGNDGGKGK